MNIYIYKFGTCVLPLPYVADLNISLLTYELLCSFILFIPCAVNDLQIVTVPTNCTVLL
jgi:hypothetical protein